MKPILAALAAVFMLAATLGADDTRQAENPALTDAQMTALVESWYRLTGEELDRKGEAGIPAVMALMHDNMRYLHPEYQANYDRDLLIDGFKRRIKRASSREGASVTTNMITGKNMLVTKRNITWEQKTDTGWEEQSKDGLTTLFEFRDGKIWRITEYWD